MGYTRANLKHCENVSHTATTTTSAHDIYVADVDVTVDRIIVAGTIRGALVSNTTAPEIGWVIAHTPTNSDITLDLSDGVPLYNDPRDVMYQWLGRVRADQTFGGIRVDVIVKGMRKLRKGDTIRILMKDEVAVAHKFDVACTVFGKYA